MANCDARRNNVTGCFKMSQGHTNKRDNPFQMCSTWMADKQCKN
jgi:hypothetical protein